MRSLSHDAPPESAAPAVVLGLGSYSPGTPVGNAEIESALAIPAQTVMDFFGVRTRYLGVDPRTGKLRDPSYCNTEFAARASERALDRARCAANDVDLIVTATSTPDSELPPPPHALQKRLGIRRADLVDVRGGCASSLQALKIARDRVASGAADCALVCGSEFISNKFYTPLVGRKSPRTEDVLNALGFADGAGAMVVGRASGRGGSIARFPAIGPINVSSRYADRRPGFTLCNGVCSHDHRAIRRIMPEVIDAARTDLLDMAGGVDRMDLVVLPQANPSLMGLHATHVFDAKRFYIGDETGNAPAAAIFRALDIAVERGAVRLPGACIGFLAVESATWMYATATIS